MKKLCFATQQSARADSRTGFAENLTELMEEISQMDRPDQKLLTRLVEELAEKDA